MASSLFVQLMGGVALVIIYLLMKKIRGKDAEVSYHTVERILIFGIAAILVVVAILID
ncbi:hypothetical protein [Polaromonas sp. YR568]|uniref:hypothetical protein n=1 Tax=Polaromonas sp. YR568 TaxID=1855301 RepID=UPI00398BDE08